MPLFLLLVGVILVTTGVRGTTEQLGTLIKGDFTGPGNFTTWLVVLLILGAISYVPKMKPLAYAFMVLVAVAIMLKEGTGFFSQFQGAATTLANGATNNSTGQTSGGLNLSSLNGLSNDFSSAADFLGSLNLGG